jgi:hypothetical protein
LGGHVLTREKAGQLVPERAVYRVLLDIAQDDARQAMAALLGEAGFWARRRRLHCALGLPPAGAAGRTTITMPDGADTT